MIVFKYNSYYYNHAVILGKIKVFKVDLFHSTYCKLKANYCCMMCHAGITKTRRQYEIDVKTLNIDKERSKLLDYEDSGIITSLVYAF